MNRTRHSGMFRPGVSGNPGGRPKAEINIRDLARSYTEKAIKTLVTIADDPKSSDAARVQACNALLNRGWGRPVQQNDVNVRQESYADFLRTVMDSDTTSPVNSNKV